MQLTQLELKRKSLDTEALQVCRAPRSTPSLPRPDEIPHFPRPLSTAALQQTGQVSSVAVMLEGAPAPDSWWEHRPRLGVVGSAYCQAGGSEEGGFHCQGSPRQHLHLHIFFVLEWDCCGAPCLFKPCFWAAGSTHGLTSSEEGAFLVSEECLEERAQPLLCHTSQAASL